MVGPGVRVGGYVLETELGRGAFGAVYRAHHAETPHRPLALKIVENRGGNLDRLLLEPALLSQIDHPGIVRLEDYFIDRDRLVLVLELIPGGDLQACLDQGVSFTPAAVRDLLVQLASALAQAHARNIVHRDIKPSNILVDRSGGPPRYVLTDFGIGRHVEGIQVEKQAGGTYLFMSPEQLLGRPGPQSDLWALGVVAYRLLTGKMPFEADTLGELSRLILHASPGQPTRAPGAEADPELEAIVLRLLEKPLTDRISSAADLLRELGHSGNADSTVDRTRPRLPVRVPSVDASLQRQVWWYGVGACVLALIWLAGQGVLMAIFLLTGLALFYRVQRGLEDAGGVTAVGLGLIAFATVLAGMGFDLGLLPSLRRAWLAELNSSNADGKWFILYSVFVVLFALLIGLSVYCYGEFRRHQRLLAIRRALLAAGVETTAYLESMRAFLECRMEDVGFHLRYAEALFAVGRVKEAAVEARLLLRQDPYHFNGNLLLAYSYHALGLFDECVAVCDAYRKVAGYCFEFAELRRLCERTGRVAL